MARRKALVTFEGWDGRWWTRIKVGKAAWDAALFVLPWKISLGIEAAKWVGQEVARGVAQRAR